MEWILGIDLGTSGVKAALINADGIIADIKSASYEPEITAGGCVEQCPDVWAKATFDVIKQMTTSHPKKSALLKAIAVSGQMHSSVFLGEDGTIVRKALLWNDVRTFNEVAEIYNTVGLPNLIKYVSNAAFPGFTLPKVLWLKKNEPANYAKVAKVIMPKDYINYCLTGVVKTDVSDAAGTLAYDVKQNNWSKEICDAVGISVDIWADALPSTGLVGEVKADMCAELGLPQGVKVYAGGADNACAAVGMGVLSPGQAALSVGTSGTVIAYLNGINSEKALEANGAVHLFNYAPEGSFYAMGCMLSAGECLNWLKRTLLSDLSFDEINEIAEKTPVGCNGLVFLPYLFGERCPHNDGNARGVFFGIGGSAGRGEFARAVMEGVAYNFKQMYDMVNGFSPIKSLVLTGGGAKSKLWAQILADVIGVPLMISEVTEGPALGAAAIAAVGCGIYKDFAEFAAITKTEKQIIEPNTNNAEIYTHRYELFKKLYASNKDNF